MYEDDAERGDFDWSDEIKEQALIDMELGIAQFEKLMPCVENAETINDLMMC